MSRNENEAVGAAPASTPAPKAGEPAKAAPQSASGAPSAPVIVSPPVAKEFRVLHEFVGGVKVALDSDDKRVTQDHAYARDSIMRWPDDFPKAGVDLSRLVHLGAIEPVIAAVAAPILPTQ